MITYLILGVFLLGTLALGLWAGKDVKTMKDYVLANRKLSTAVVTMSLVATVIASGDLQHPNHIFRFGIIDMLVPICFTISFLLIGWLIVPNMVYFQDCLTTGDLMNKFYGKGAGIFTGVINCLFSILIISSQLRAIGNIGKHLLGLPAGNTILLIGLLVVIYTTLSGMRGVAYTDVLQFICMVVVLIVLIHTLVYRIGGLAPLFKRLPSEKIAVFNNPGLSRAIKAGVFWGIFPTYLFSPPIVNRMLMVSNKKQVRWMFFSGASIYATIRLTLMLIGLGAVVYFDNLSVQLPANRNTYLVGYLGSMLFTDNTIMRLFLFIGLLFVMVSTIDSFLHSIGITTVHDFIKAFCNRQKIVINEIKWARWATLLIGVIAVALGFMGRKLPFTLTGHTRVLMQNLIIIPLIIGILGIKTDKISFLIFSSVCGAAWWLLTYFTTLDRYVVFFISVTIATLLFFISHYIINKGFALVKRTKNTASYRLYLPSWNGFIGSLASLCIRPAKLVELARKKVYEYGKDPFLFSIFIIIIWMVPAKYHTESSIILMTIVKFIGIALCCGLMLEVKWLNFLKSYFALYYFFTLLYCLPFVGTLSFLINTQSTSGVMSLSLALILLMLCVDWKSFFVLSIIGTAAAIMVHRMFVGYFLPVISFDIGWSLATTVSVVLLAGLLFARRKQRYNTDQLRKTKLYAGSIAHETKNYLGTALFAGDYISQAIQKKQITPLEEGAIQEKEALYTIPKQLAEDLIELGPELLVGARQSFSKIDLFMSALREDILSAKLERCSIKACVQEAVKDTYFKDEEVKKGLVLKLGDDFIARVPKDYFKHIIYNLVKNAYYHGGATEVIITLNAAQRTLSIQDNGSGIDSASLPHIFDLFYSGGDANSGIGLALVKLIVEACGASIYCASKQGEGCFTRFTVSFP